MVRHNGLVFVGVLWLVGCAPQNAPVVKTESKSALKDGLVACTGSIEPAKGLVMVAAGSIAGKVPIVGRLLVKQGDVVKQGQVLAELTAIGELQAAVRQAEARVQLAESHVAQVEAPMTESNVRAGQAQIERLEVELRGAQAELKRKEGLIGKDLLPRVQLDGARLQVEQIGKQLAEARQRVAALNERRPADVAVAKAELAGARADLERARVEAGLGTILAPEAGRVVRVFATAGEAVGPGGLLEIAADGPMVVIADVYESDVARVKVGQKAKISAAIFGQPIMGTVAWISPQIVPRSAPTLDPTIYTEGRVFQTRIEVADGKVLADRIHAQVNVTIEP